MKCTMCDGRGKLLGIFPKWADYVPLEEREPFVFINCPICKSKGDISHEQMEWIKQGEILRQRRLERRIGVREAATMIQMLPSRLASMEQGACCPNMGISYDTMKIIKQ